MLQRGIGTSAGLSRYRHKKHLPNLFGHLGGNDPISQVTALCGEHQMGVHTYEASCRKDHHRGGIDKERKK